MAKTRSTSKFTAGQAFFGAVLLGLGIAVLSLIAWENSSGLPWNMPRIWYGSRTTWLAIATSFVLLGLYVMVHGPRESSVSQRRTRWQPSQRGRRFQTVILYTRDGCHLCDEAFDLLQNYAAYLPVTREVDIDLEPSLRQQWDTWVPVVEIDGKVRFKGRVSELLLRRLIEGNSPV